MMCKFANMKVLIISILIQLAAIINLFSQNNSILSTGNWYKISTNKNGVYKLKYSDFIELGIDKQDIQIDDIKLYGNGGGMLPKLNSDFRNSDLIQNRIHIYDDNSNGIFENSDYILFYGMSPDVWKLNSNTNLFEHEIHLFDDEVHYFITINNLTLGKRILEKNIQQIPSKIISSYNSYLYYGLELENLISSGNKWFGNRFSIQRNQSFDFNFSDLVTSEYLNVKVAAVARSFQPANFAIDVNSSFLTNLAVPTVSSDYAKEFAKEVATTNQFLSNSSNVNVNIEFSSADSGAEAWLDYIEINARKDLKLRDDYLIFSDINSLENSFGEFRIENAIGAEVWDISNPLNVKKILTSNLSNSLTFTDSLHSLHQYIAFNNLKFLNPSLKGKILNQNIHNTSSNVEFIIVCHPNFLSAANRLADFHLEKDDLVSFVVTPQQIYNEFSSGMQDVTAIRDFVKLQYNKQDSELKYLLLFGDGSFDHKDRIQNNTNYIPTYQSANSTHPLYSYVTDDFFGLLDDNEGLFNNDLVDIGIGRFPVSTLSEANILVDKVEQYYKLSSFGNWRNNITFIADDGDADDGNTHMWQADSLANHIADNYNEINIKKIYLDNYEQESTPAGPRSPDTQNAINNTLEKGALLVNFIGHGGPLGWTQERILELDQINNWSNFDNLPLFMTATCKFSNFDNPKEKSAGEYLFLNPEGGAIALLSTTRLVFSYPNYNLNTKFINTIFEKKDGEYQTIGDLFKTTKVLSGTAANNRNFTLLGDPALRLAYPKFEIRTVSINDTLKALGEVSIEGVVENQQGMLLSEFNGTIYATVFDKEIIRTTLGQESCIPMPYRDQNNIIYKGAATVENGQFSISFIVPKDISYNYGAGKVSYYATNNDDQIPLDANGVEEDFVIGGTADNIIYDYNEAEMSLFMNDTLFKNGGITDSNPILLAKIFDDSGINTVGNGIGHDITAILDGDTYNPFILNDFYESNKDDYTRGTIRFPLYDLLPGEHTISLKVWDVFNNSSESQINFSVTDGDDFIIENFTANPNPFSISTDIYFQHNKPNQKLDYVLEIYSITGFLIKKITKRDYYTEGYRIGPISWEGNDDYGSVLSPGMYIANLNIRSDDGDFATKSIRIILLPQ